MDHRDAPVVIGGIGGSGTRVVAKICMTAGYFMGVNLNKANDSKDIHELYKQGIDPWLSRSQIPLTDSQNQEMDEKFWQCIAAHRAWIPSAEAKWGWKHPRSIYLLPFFNKYYPHMKFIHVIRDGRDMAYSRNQEQLKSYGHLLLERKWDNLRPESRSMLLWSRVNLETAKYGENVMVDRYIRVRFEDLCNQPESTLRALLIFLGELNVDLSVFKEIIKPPESIGRWRNQAKEQLSELLELGSPALLYFGYQ